MVNDKGNKGKQMTTMENSKKKFRFYITINITNKIAGASTTK